MTHKEYNRRISQMDKVLQIKKDFKALLPEIEQERYIQMLGHIYWFHRNKKEYFQRIPRRKEGEWRKLTPAEIIMLDYLLKNNINPKTIYKWFHVCKLPEDIQTKLRNNEITSVVEARKIATNRMRQRDSNAGLLMLEEIKGVITSL